MHSNVVWPATRLTIRSTLSVFVFGALISSVPMMGQNFTSKEPIVSAHELSIPPKAQNQLSRGVAKLHKRDLQGSLRDFAAAIAIYPNYYEAYYDQGIAQSILRQNDQALDSFQKAIDLSEGKYPRAEFGYGLVLSRVGRFVEAEAVIRRGLEEAPYISDGYVMLGVALLKQGRIDEAEKLARQSLAMGDAGAGKGYLLLSDIHANRKEYTAQVEDLDAYLSMNPDDPDGKVLRATRDAAKAVASRTAEQASR